MSRAVALFTAGFGVGRPPLEVLVARREFDGDLRARLQVDALRRTEFHTVREVHLDADLGERLLRRVLHGALEGPGGRVVFEDQVSAIPDVVPPRILREALAAFFAAFLAFATGSASVAFAFFVNVAMLVLTTASAITASAACTPRITVDQTGLFSTCIRDCTRSVTRSRKPVRRLVPPGDCKKEKLSQSWFRFQIQKGRLPIKKPTTPPARRYKSPIAVM